MLTADRPKRITEATRRPPEKSSFRGKVGGQNDRGTSPQSAHLALAVQNGAHAIPTERSLRCILFVAPLRRKTSRRRSRCWRRTSCSAARSYSGPTTAREAVAPLLLGVSRVFEDFRYTREIGAPDAPDHALVFQARVGNREIEGCDFLHTNEETG